MHRCLTFLIACLTIACAPAAAASAVDSTDAAADSTISSHPAWAWRLWPSIGPAIAIAALDGPQDIVEKEEILADRIDALALENTRLDTLAGAWQARQLAMTAQLEVLEDLADMQLGGDLEVQQRLESVRQDIQQATREVEFHLDVQRALRSEIDRLRSLAATYRQRAAQLRAEEESLR